MSTNDNTASNTATPASGLPPHVDTATATCNATYTEQEVREDAVGFGDWVVDGTWFYAVEEKRVYRLETETAPYTFTLKQGERLHPEPVTDGEDPNDGEQYPVTSIAELSGELLAGYLRGIPPGTAIETDTATISNTGEYLLVLPDDDQTTSLAELADSAVPVNARYTDGTPESLITPADEQALAQTRNDSNLLIYSVNGTRTGIAHLLPTDDPHAAPSVTTDTTSSTVTADGGAIPGTSTQGVHTEIDEVPYFPAETPEMVTRFVPTSRHLAETFQEPNLRRYALAYMDGRVLNACAGPTDLSEWYTDGEIVRNDLHPDVPSDLSVDIAELACHFPANSFDTIVFDPPWTAYQSRMRYDGYVVHKAADDDLPVSQINIDMRDLPFKVPGEDAIATADGGAQLTLGDDYEDTSTITDSASTAAGEAMSEQYDEYIQADEQKEQIGHARLAKLGFDYLLKPEGRIIQYAYTGSVMPAALDYKRLDRTAFDPTGTYRTLIGGVDEKQS